jgi:Co/Zn/Cd efflux system component
MTMDANHMLLDVFTYFLSFYAQLDRDRKQNSELSDKSTASSYSVPELESSGDVHAHQIRGHSDPAHNPNPHVHAGISTSSSTSAGRTKLTAMELMSAFVTTSLLFISTIILLSESLHRLSMPSSKSTLAPSPSALSSSLFTSASSPHHASSQSQSESPVSGSIMMHTTMLGLFLSVLALYLFTRMESQDGTSGIFHAHSHGIPGLSEPCSAHHDHHDHHHVHSHSHNHDHSQHSHSAQCDADHSDNQNGSGSASTATFLTMNLNLLSSFIHLAADVIRTIIVLIAGCLIYMGIAPGVTTDAYSSLLVSGFILVGCSALLVQVVKAIIQSRNEVKWKGKDLPDNEDNGRIDAHAQNNGSGTGSGRGNRFTHGQGDKQTKQDESFPSDMYPHTDLAMNDLIDVLQTK